MKIKPGYTFSGMYVYYDPDRPDVDDEVVDLINRAEKTKEIFAGADYIVKKTKAINAKNNKIYNIDIYGNKFFNNGHCFLLTECNFAGSGCNLKTYTVEEIRKNIAKILQRDIDYEVQKLAEYSILLESVK